MNPSDLTLTREKLGYSKAELASIFRVTYLTVHRWELEPSHKENRRIPGWAEAFLERLLKEKADTLDYEGDSIEDPPLSSNP